VQTPEFDGITFHEVLAKTALNQVPMSSRMMPGAWTINPYRGCSHACLYCYARSTHRYLDLDTGADFDSQIVVKVNVADVLARELATKRSLPGQVALGTNTDPYQRAEGRYALMPGIIAALSEHRVPFSILTKGTLLRRDLPLLAEVSETQQVSLAMSIAIFDDELQQSLEPGTPTTAARLATVRMVRDRGMPCAVFLAPILPSLTDSREHLDRALAMISEAGGTSVLFTPLRLGPDVKDWFMGWLAREHPHLLGRYSELYGQGSTTPEGYRRVLAARMKILLRRHGLLDASEGGLSDQGRAAARGFSLDRPPTARASGEFGPTAPVARPQGAAVGADQPGLF
jgi:DNA repair photolyase